MIFRFYALKTSSIIKYHALYISLLLCAFRVLLIENCIFQQQWERAKRNYSGDYFEPFDFAQLCRQMWLWRKVGQWLSRQVNFRSPFVSSETWLMSEARNGFFLAFEDSTKSFSQLFDNLSSKPFSISEISSRSVENEFRPFLKTT